MQFGRSRVCSLPSLILFAARRDTPSIRESVIVLRFDALAWERVAVYQMGKGSVRGVEAYFFEKS